MIPVWIGKIIATRVIKAVKHKIDLNKIDKSRVCMLQRMWM